MKICEKIVEIQEALKKVRAFDRKIAFVPTMGALHEGHLHLIEEAKKAADFVVVSIFVNKAQFNDLKDFEKYPRTIEQDLKLLESKKVDFVFLPENEEVYPNGVNYDVKIGEIGKILCGANRKNHFEGVVLVLRRFFEIIEPNLAFFGKKDFQQYFIVKKFFGDKIEIVGIETIREKSGLAMSSRNKRLSYEDQKKAGLIFEILSEIKNKIKTVENIEKFLQNKREEFLKNGFEKIDYLEIRDEDSLALFSRDFDKAKNYRIFVAVFLKGVRLIDNMRI